MEFPDFAADFADRKNYCQKKTQKYWIFTQSMI